MQKGALEMGFLQTIVNSLNSLGSTIILPIIMFVLGMLFGIGWRKSFSAGLMLGIAFAGISAVMGFMFNAISPAASAIVDKTGRHLANLDLGWVPSSAIAWAWPFAFLMFPIQIGINIVMLALGWTECLNVDMWNVWQKAFTGALVAGFSGSVALGIFFAAVQVVLELKQADISRYQIEELTGIKGVSLPHNLFLDSIIVLPLRTLLLKVFPGIKNLKMSPEQLREKIGIFGENHVLGFLVGLFMGILARYDVKGILQLAISAGTGLVLIPMVARLFITAMMPIADGAKEIISKRFPGREFSIGLDWPFTAGITSLWVAAIINVPIMLALALILPGNTALPYGGVLNLVVTITAAIICKNDVLQTTIISAIMQPMYLYGGTFWASTMTALAKATGAVQMPTGGMGLTFASMDSLPYRTTFAWVASIFTKGQILPGIIVAPALAALYVWYYRKMVKEDKEAAARLGYTK
jgi:PTS system galactitol-specific IIC component